MSVLSINGMDNISSVQQLIDGNSGLDFSASAGTINYLPAGGLMGGGALHFTTTGARINNSTAITASSLGVLGQFRLPTSVAAMTLVQISNGIVSWNDNQSSVSHARVMVTAAGAVEFWSGQTTALRQVLFPEGTIVPDTYYYFCAWFTRSSGNVTLAFKLNNVLVTTGSHTYGTTLNNHYLMVYGGAHYDDLCMATANLTSLPPQAVHSVVPGANRATQGLAHTGAANAWEAVSELPPDDATSYIYSGTPGDASEFDLSDLPAYVTDITALRTTARAARDNTGGNVNIDTTLHLTAGDTVQTVNALLVDDTWVTTKGGVLTQNPVTVAPFTPSEVNSMYTRHEVVV